MNIQENVNLQPYNTFHLECIADHFVEITKIEDFHELMQTQIFQDNPRLILGWGSNILLSSERFEGLVIMNNILGKEIIEQDDTSITIQVWAGENRNDFVRRSIEQGYSGIENLVSIPWSVGAAPIQNIWAYGVEAKSVITNVKAIMIPPVKGVDTPKWNGEVSGGLESEVSKPRLQSDLVKLSNSQCNFSYRSSIFKTELKDQTFITHVVFKLQKYNQDSYIPTISYGAIRDKLSEKSPLIQGEWRSQRVCPGAKGDLGGFENLDPHLLATTIADIRASKLPDRTKIWTAWSFFKNPIVSQEIFDKLQSQFPNLKWFPTNIPFNKHRHPVYPERSVFSGERNEWMQWTNVVEGSPESTNLKHNIESEVSKPRLQSDLVKLSAGQLIDLSWLKGITKWKVGTYQNHALVLVNHGWGTGKELTALAKHIQDTVRDTFGIMIEPEVNYV